MSNEPVIKVLLIITKLKIVLSTTVLSTKYFMLEDKLQVCEFVNIISYFIQLLNIAIIV